MIMRRSPTLQLQGFFSGSGNYELRCNYSYSFYFPRRPIGIISPLQLQFLFPRNENRDHSGQHGTDIMKNLERSCTTQMNGHSRFHYSSLRPLG